MRAFLSTGHAGFDKLRPDLYEADAAYIDRVTCSEARAILAETESPFMFAEHYRIRPLYLSGGDNYLLSSIRAALAESLRSFVEA